MRPDRQPRLSPAPVGFQDIGGSLGLNTVSEHRAPPAIADDSLAGPAFKSEASRPELTTPTAAAAHSPPAARERAGGADKAADPQAAEIAAAVQKQILSGGGGDLETLLAYVRSGRL